MCRRGGTKFGFVWTLFFLRLAMAGAQGLPEPRPPLQNPADEADPVGLIGMSVRELIDFFGAPESVYPSRGLEPWQDDVVFVYPKIDFYLFKDMVWQVSLDSANGISKGDPRAAVLLVLGEKAQDKKSYILDKVPNVSWPLEWRFNIDNAGKVSAIYLYRMDY
jgi:hypothetical protein